MFKLVPIRPVRKIQHMQNTEAIFDQFFDNFFNDNMMTSLHKMENPMHNFPVDVIDEGDEYIIIADLPGFSKEQIKLEYKDKHLIISGQRVQEDEDVNYVRRERTAENVQRRFFVDHIDHNAISANFNNGVLTITLKKSPISYESKEIIID